MFCSNCGTQLLDEANFCWKCGKPQKLDSQLDEFKWETCEVICKIRYEGLLETRKGRFIAQAIGPNGIYEAGKTDEFKLPAPYPEIDRHGSTYNLLIVDLVKDGWESTGDRGDGWWSQRFRRCVKVRISH